jgi:quercetin dioxygenase-like cupin family protein
MSKRRQGPKFDPVGVRGTVITTFRTDYPDGFVSPDHYHEFDQLIFACEGVMTVDTA